MQTTVEIDADELAERLDEYAASLGDNLESAMEEATELVLADAQETVNVDTGELRDSIEAEVERVGQAVVQGDVGADVDHAAPQEAINPYLRPAITNNLDQIESLFEEAVAEAKAEVGFE